MSKKNSNIDKSTNVSITWLKVGAFICMLSVIIGAFAAHGLKAMLSEYQLGIVDTAAKYQMYHGLAILIASTIFLVLPAASKKIHLVNTAFSVGCILFSGSLYCLAVSGIKIFAYFTPLGGLSFVVGWGLLIWAIHISTTQIKSNE